MGVAGITPGGGIGFLSRRFGLTIDDLLGGEVVTADGRTLQVDDEHEPELFRAIRGGAFGVVTELRFRLHEVTTVTNGMPFFDPDAALLASLVGLLADGPDGVSSMANVMPPLPMVPAELHGRQVIMAGWCTPGRPTKARACSTRSASSPRACSRWPARRRTPPCWVTCPCAGRAW